MKRNFVIGIVCSLTMLLLTGVATASDWWRPVPATPLIPVIDPLSTNTVIPSSGVLYVGGGVLLNSTASRPACSASTRSLTWFNTANLGVADGVSVCIKTALDTYLWKDVNLV